MTRPLPKLKSLIRLIRLADESYLRTRKELTYTPLPLHRAFITLCSLLTTRGNRPIESFINSFIRLFRDESRCEKSFIRRGNKINTQMEAPNKMAVCVQTQLHSRVQAHNVIKFTHLFLFRSEKSGCKFARRTLPIYSTYFGTTCSIPRKSITHSNINPAPMNFLLFNGYVMPRKEIKVLLAESRDAFIYMETRKYLFRILHIPAS